MSDNQSSTDGRRGPRSQGPRGPQLRGEARDAVRTAVADGYRAQASIRQLAAEHGLSFGLTRTLLHEAGVTMRGRSGRRTGAGQ
ncbi:helix-turn-helix domain-containing protein [Streptomyces sp. NPDC127037]|uniref:helix-turn-helix domain-containing protein n=1 Tax=Streptomyces sp. NPDC127037 TaxID=3347113 RepID=UPI003666E0E3